MTEDTRPHPITIDLDQFKLHISLKHRIELTLHFNSPSRKFYLSVIALVVNEMKRQGKMTSIPLGGHQALLALLNETVGGSAGSSERENLIPRIYRKWKDALPNLEEAPLFKVLGRRKEYDEGTGKIYSFTEAEKDSWANLFEYKGSEENVRLKFAIDRMGAGLDDVDIIYEDSVNGDAWKRFILSLKDKVEIKTEKEEIDEVHKEPVAPVPAPRKWKIAWPSQYRWGALIVAIGVVAGAAITIWGFYIRNTPQPEVTPKEKIASLQHEKSLGPTKGNEIGEVAPKEKVASPKPEKVSRTVTSATPKLEVASKDKTAFPLPDKPSIAVLPFVNMSEDPEQEFFSDGLTEEITTTLSKSPNLFVIARTSTFVYKGKPIRVNEVAEQLGVRYVLEGSVRRSGEKIRISAQLIDATTGHHLWAERFDRGIKDILDVQDEIALKIMKALHLKLQAGQLGSETGRGAKNVDIFLKSIEAREQVLRYSKEGNARARKLFEEVIAMDPHYARGYTGLAISYAAEVWLGSSKSPKESLERAIEFGEKAIFLDESDATAQSALAYLYAMTRQYDKAVSQAERALAIDPNSFSVVNNCGIALAYSGKHQEALPLIEKAVRLNPSVAQSFVVSSMAYRILGRYEDAFQQAKKAVGRNPKSQLAQVALTATCILTGREEEARAAAAEVLKINPKFSAEQYGRTLPFKDNSQIDLMTNALRKAGLN
jgi:TolB-like protein/Tfp pilus assembly protein PilF